MSTELDIVQYHMMSMIVGLMESYGLTPDHITKQYEYISSIPYDQRTNKYLEPEPLEQEFTAKSRREFSMLLSNGHRICPNYSECSKPKCDMIHIPNECLCPHKKKNNYCIEDSKCELIVLKACRDGSHCESTTCSYRHDN